MIHERIILGELPTQSFTKEQTEKAINVVDSEWKILQNMLEYIVKNSNNELCVRQSLESMQSLLKLTGSIVLTGAVQNVVGRLCV